MSEILPGWSWFKFDIDGWLSSKDVQCMNMNDRGMYTHLLIIQARDGKLDADLRHLAKQENGVDYRSVKSWMKKWGYLFPIIGLDPDLMVAQAQRPCSVHAASPQPTCSVCVAPALPLRCFPAASWMRGRSARVNPKLWNLQVNTGKFASLPIIEEKRGEGILEGELEGDNTTVVLTCKKINLYLKV